MRHSLSRRGFIAATGVGLGGLGGCLGVPRGTESSRGGRATGAPSDGNRSGGPAPTTAADVLPLPVAPDILRNRVISGGPPKDGIPAIDEPAFQSAAAADEWLDPRDPVFGVAGETEVKAYPQAILVHHEICNDVVNGRPVSLTYCPLTGTAMGFERGETTFGVSGRLVNNNLIMYDRATETWWPQVLATAIPGLWNIDPPIRSLSGFQVVWTTWSRWRDRYPETQVLSRDTGFARNYDADPYGAYNPLAGYYVPDTPPMARSFSKDDRFPPKTVVIGARTVEGAVAFRKDALRSAKLMEGRLGGVPHLAVYEPALDAGYVYRNPDGVSFDYRDGEVAGPGDETVTADALPLDRVLSFDAFWFAWSGFYPDADVEA